MKSLHSQSQSTSMRARTAAIGAIAIVWFASVSPARGAVSPQPTAEATPAFMFLDVPAAGARTATEWPVVSFSYDAEAGVPIHRHDAAIPDDANVRVTMLFAKTDTALPLAPKTTYASFVLVETDAARAPIKRLTFHGVTIDTIGPAGDDPSVKVTFTSRTVTTT